MTAALSFAHSASIGRTSQPRMSALARMTATFGRTVAIARQRRRLAALDDHLLADIGVSRPQALAEATRPAWDAPTNWRI